MAMGVPGWPEFACCTASMESVRMVLTESVWRSGVGITGFPLTWYTVARDQTMAPEIIVDKRSDLPATLARRFEDEGRRALAGRGLFSLALPGGSVATTFFPRLSRAAVDWRQAAREDRKSTRLNSSH